MHAHLNLLAIRQLFLLYRAGQPLQIAHEYPVHAALVHAARGEGVASPGAQRMEEGTAFDAGSPDVLGYGFRCAEVDLRLDLVKRVKCGLKTRHCSLSDATATEIRNRSPTRPGFPVLLAHVPR